MIVVQPLHVVVVGLGAIGAAIAKRCHVDPNLRLVGAVDPAFAGRPFGSVTVQDAIDRRLADGAHVAVVATASSLAAIASQLEELLALGLDVASTSEELAYPWSTQPELARRLDDAARNAGRTLVGCGVNPGFVMDVLPVIVASASLGCRRLEVQRSANLDRRRPQLRAKLGVGLRVDEWREQPPGRFGHRGLSESALLCAHALGWDVAAKKFSREPLHRDGEVSGVLERTTVTAADARTVELELRFDGGIEDRDVIRVGGDPEIEVHVVSGVSGDTATVARALHAARSLAGAPPGLVLPTGLVPAPPCAQVAREAG